MPSDAEDWDAVETLDDFAAYLALLGETMQAQATPAATFLQSLGEWVGESYLQPLAPFAELRPEPSWREFARMLCVTRDYA
ncbi:MAG: hypothetical protein ACRDMZ_17395 [Solirubrobacteraceae bacterium]